MKCTSVMLPLPLIARIREARERLTLGTIVPTISEVHREALRRGLDALIAEATKAGA